MAIPAVKMENITRFTDPEVVNILLSVKVTDESLVTLRCLGAEFFNCQVLGVLGDHDFEVQSLELSEIAIVPKVSQPADSNPNPAPESSSRKRHRERFKNRKETGSFCTSSIVPSGADPQVGEYQDYPTQDSESTPATCDQDEDFFIPELFPVSEVKVEPTDDLAIFGGISSEPASSKDSYYVPNFADTSERNDSIRRSLGPSRATAKRSMKYHDRFSHRRRPKDTEVRKDITGRTAYRLKAQRSMLTTLRKEKYKGLLSRQLDGTWMCTSCNLVKPTVMAIKLHIHGAHLSAANSGMDSSRVDSMEAIRSLNSGNYKSIKCDICGHIVKALGAHTVSVLLMTHKATQHGIDSGETHPCQQCSKTYPTVLMLRQHVKGVHRNPKVECPVEGCSSKIRASALKRHIQCLHSGDQGHVCDKCGITFKCSSSLTHHLTRTRAHGAERKVRCDWPGCQKRFFTKKHLKVHRRLHTDEKPFVCELCGFRARQYTSLSYHNKMHHKKIHEETPKIPDPVYSIDN